MTKVSVIVPVYNSEKWLRRCINSIVAQSFTDWELILVDDGSTDGSGTICDEYAARDRRIRAIHQDNGGVSAARNRGITEAHNKWIAFVDSDDLVKPDYLHVMVEAANQYPDAKLVMQGFIVAKGKTMTKRQMQSKFYGTNDIDVFLQDVAIGHFTGPYCKLYSTKILTEIWFDESLKFGEDTNLFLNYIYRMYGAIVTIKDCNYLYVDENANSLSKHIMEFDSAFATLEALSNTIGEFKKRFNGNEYCDKLNSFLGYLTELALFSIYNCGVKKRNTRIGLLKKINDQCRQYYAQRITRPTLFLKIVIWCFVHNYDYLLDTVMHKAIHK